MAALLLPSAAAAQWLPRDAEFGYSARAQIDHSAFGGVSTDTGATATARWLRRAEASARLRLNPRWRASATVAHDDDRLVLDTASLGWQPTDRLRLRAGRIDPDFGLDNANSSSWTAGVERSAVFDLVPGVADAERGWGLRVDGHGRGWHASGGLYDKRDRTAVVGRAVWMAVPAPARVLQLGASVARAQGFDDDGRLRTRLGLRGVSEDPAGRRSGLAPAVAPPARYDRDTALGLEVAAQHSGWLLQAEAVRRHLAGSAGAPVRRVSGQSLQLAWSPSAQPRRHDEAAARFGRPQGDSLPRGRFELFYRFDALEGSDGLSAWVHTLGASWFLDRHWRVSANAVRNRSDDPNRTGEHEGQGWVVRGQATF